MDIRLSYAAFGRFVQGARLLKLQTPLGPDALLVARVSAEEAFNLPYAYTVQCLALSDDIELKRLIGQPVSLAIELERGAMRKVSGYVMRAAMTGSDGGFARYEIEFGPWFAFLGLRTDSFIFQEKSALEVITEVFADYPTARFAIDVAAELPKRSYLVQYQETDLAFVTRLCEEEGLHFWFEFDRAGAHTLVIADDPDAYLPLGSVRGAAKGEVPRVRFHRSAATETHDTIDEWRALREVRVNAAAYTSPDYQPAVVLGAALASTADNGALPALEHYEYAGAYAFGTQAAGERYARLRIEAEEAAMKRFAGAGNVRALAIGQYFQLAGHPQHDRDPTEDRQFVPGRLAIAARNNFRLAENAELTEDPGEYRVRFEAQRRLVILRPLARTPKPRIAGPQTVRIVGPAGEEVYTDALNRVKAQFHWDRAGAHDERSSCWLRVASPNADADWGGVFVPRIGQECVVEFLDGNPDRPLITASVYNGPRAPAWHSDGRLAGLKSKELAGAGFNALVLDDTSGKSRVTLGSTQYADQLNLGWLPARPYANDGGPGRGHGFELRTDAAGALRAAKGLLLTTDPRPEGQSTQADAREAASALKLHGERLARLGAFSVGHNNLDLASHKAASETSQAAQDWQRPLLVASSPAGIAATTPADLHLAAGRHVALSSESDTNIAAAGSLAIAIQGAIGFFAGERMKLFAAKGPVQLQAQSEALEITADKDVRVTSVNDEIFVVAPKEIVLNAGGATIRIADGNIDLHAPGIVSVKGVQRKFSGPDAMTVGLPAMPRSEPAPEELKFEIVLQDIPGPFGAPLSDRQWTIARLNRDVAVAEPSDPEWSSRLDPAAREETLAQGCTGSDGKVALTDADCRRIWEKIREYPGQIFLLSGLDATPLGVSRVSGEPAKVDEVRILDALNYALHRDELSNSMTAELKSRVESNFDAALRADPKSKIEI